MGSCGKVRRNLKNMLNIPLNVTNSENCIERKIFSVEISEGDMPPFALPLFPTPLPTTPTCVLAVYNVC